MRREDKPGLLRYKDYRAGSHWDGGVVVVPKQQSGGREGDRLEAPHLVVGIGGSRSP